MLETEYQKIGRRIRTLRLMRGVSQGELAKKLGLSQTNLSNIERGRTKATLKNLFKIRRILKCAMIEFFEDGLSMQEMARAIRLYRKEKRAGSGQGR